MTESLFETFELNRPICPHRDNHFNCPLYFCLPTFVGILRKDRTNDLGFAESWRGRLYARRDFRHAFPRCSLKVCPEVFLIVWQIK
jgi:hypothetical protein